VSDEYLSLRNIKKSYGGKGGVDDVSIAVAEGEMLVLLGPSGCGKTTLLRSIAGLLTPDAGQVVLAGSDLTRVPTHKRNISMVFQTWALFPTMTVAQNVGFGLRMQGVPRTERAARVADVLKLVRLSELAQRRPRELSGGQQQRVALARAIVTRPRVLLLDEPLSSLDQRIRLELRGELKRLQRRLGMTGVYVTHDHDEALALGDRIAVMDTGRIVEVGHPRQVFRNPTRRYTAEFLGLANVIPVRPGPGIGTYETDLGPAKLKSPADGPDIVAVAVRPENVDVFLAPGAADGTQVTGTVVAVEYRSGGALHEIELPGGATLRAVVPGEQVLDIDDVVGLSIDWDKAVPLID
jgi:ABC-type Fe3+/spermidine/putrescine transport system ATPase subunit